MTQKQKHYKWFEEKHYGWGWMPITWQGWGIVFIYAGSVYLEVVRIGSAAVSAREALGALSPRLVGMTILLIAICWLTGGTPRLRWGDRIWK